MVHGINFGVRYIITLNKKIDYYDIFLPICTLLRRMISIIDDNKIVILDNNILEKRFSKLPLVNEYVENLQLFKYHRQDDIDLKWVDVYKYSSKIKFLKSDIIKTEEEIDEYREKVEIIKKKYDNNIHLMAPKNEIIEYDNMVELIELNEIVHHENYFNCIKDLEQKITNVELDNNEIELINKIKAISLLDGLIEDEGFELMSNKY
jgi:hypothetical protein